jgi:pimeloyl-ACP methyl ester carboxylesterase
VPGTARERIAIDRGGLMPEARTIEIRGGAVTFKVLTSGRGAPLVYFHSYFERNAWSPFLDLLARSFSVFAPAHPGVAGSSGIETLDDLLDLTLAYDELFTALGVERAHLVGHSFGAMAAAELAAVCPVRAQSLTLVSPLGLWRDDAPPADILILPADELAAVLWRDPASRVAGEWAVGSGGDPEDIAAQVESLQRRSSMAKFVWPIPDKGLRRRLHRIAAPTLLVWGDEDRANPVVYAEEWQRRIKGAALRLLPGSHMVLHETPELAARAVVELARS